MYGKDFKITVPVETKVSILEILKRMPLCLFVSNFSPQKRKKKKGMLRTISVYNKSMCVGGVGGGGACVFISVCA